MSDIAQNAARYNAKNTKRSDAPNMHNGEVTLQNVLRFDCSGFVSHILIESGYRVNYEPTSRIAGSSAFSTLSHNMVRPGDIILFSGHVGIVTEYNPTTTLGRFIHMRGRNNEGGIETSYFVYDESKYKEIINQHDHEDPIGPDLNTIFYGTSWSILAFKRIKSDRYSADMDLHPHGSNPHATLRPLGTRVYSDHIVRTTKPTKTNLAEKAKNLPTHTKLPTKSVPQQDGFAKLIRRVFGKLPDF